MPNSVIFSAVSVTNFGAPRKFRSVERAITTGFLTAPSPKILRVALRASAAISRSNWRTPASRVYS